MLPSLSQNDLAALGKLTTCEVSNAIEMLGGRLRNEGFMDATVRSMFPELPPVTGYAVTVKIKCSSPSTDGQNYLERTEWWNEILRIPAPRIVVIEDIDPRPGTGALVGALHANLLKALKCVAVITNGAVRDLPDVRALPFHLFAGNVAVSHAYAHLVEMRVPVTVGKLTIEPGDLLHADCHGVISLPPSQAASIPAIAAKRFEQEEELIQLCGQPNPPIEELRAKVRQLRNQSL
jgi:regulator of RNase E activity RraA